ncbi:hypothetical protein ALC53_01525 [Atta colombica]|uniref:Uncharacterized protein n=1 Tax=Atta colombica TaxID=520822 RepID=A0A195BUN3_9HYME|nr:hypothetical protein ALC53_01525 [Atta colombica]
MKTHTRVCVRGRRPKNEIIISVDSDQHSFFPQCLVYASSGKLRGSGVPAREGHSLEKRIARDLRRRQRKPIRKDTECRKEGERRNKTERKRERNREKRSVEIRDNARKILEGSVHHDSSRIIKGDPTRASSEWLRYPVRLWFFDEKEKRKVQVSGRGKHTNQATNKSLIGREIQVISLSIRLGTYLIIDLGQAVSTEANKRSS